MSNPNNCATCEHKARVTATEGHCYMFRWEPTEPCAQHTSRFEAAKAMRMQALKFVKRRCATHQGDQT